MIQVLWEMMRARRYDHVRVLGKGFGEWVSTVFGGGGGGQSRLGMRDVETLSEICTSG